MKFQIKDFVDLHQIEIEGHINRNEPLVLLTQRGGSMSFQHSMRPEQARFMAGALVMAAEQIEAKVVHLPSDDTEGGAV